MIRKLDTQNKGSTYEIAWGWGKSCHNYKLGLIYRKKLNRTKFYGYRQKLDSVWIRIRVKNKQYHYKKLHPVASKYLWKIFARTQNVCPLLASYQIAAHSSKRCVCSPPGQLLSRRCGYGQTWSSSKKTRPHFPHGCTGLCKACWLQAPCWKKLLICVTPVMV